MKVIKLTKKEFLQQLNISLKRLPADEREDMLQDFEEHFAIGLAEGKKEAEIAAALGSPRQIAKDAMASYHLEQAGTKATPGNVFRAMWAIIGLGFFNLVIVLGPFIGLVSMIFAGWVVAVSFIASPFLWLIQTILYAPSFTMFELFASIALCGLGIFIALGMFYVTRILSKWFVRYLKFNARLVKGGLIHDNH